VTLGWLLLLVMCLTNARSRARLADWVRRPRKPFAVQAAIQVVAGVFVGWALFVCGLFAYLYVGLLLETVFG
jgi:hypothetical protein